MPPELNESRLNLAHILSTACLMEQARQTLAQIDTTQLTPDQFITYYRTRTDLLIYQAEYMQGTRYADEAVRQLIAVRQRVAALDGPKDNVSYLVTKAECLADGGNQQQAIDLLATLLPATRAATACIRSSPARCRSTIPNWATRTTRCSTSSRAPRVTWRAASARTRP